MACPCILMEETALHTIFSKKSLLFLAIAGAAACAGCAHSGQLSSEAGGALQNADTAYTVSSAADTSENSADVSAEASSAGTVKLSAADVVIPSAEAVRSFFEKYGAEESVSEFDGNRFVEYGISDDPSYCGSLNYDEDGTRLRNANFQIYGEAAPADAEEFFTEAAALFFPKETPDVSAQESSGSAVQEASGDDSLSFFIKEAVGQAGEEEHASYAAAGDMHLSIFTRPSDTAAPRYEMMIDLPADGEQNN